MRAGDYGEMLLGVAAALDAELGGSPGPSTGRLADLAAPGALELSHVLEVEDRMLVESLRTALAKIAVALYTAAEPEGPPATAAVIAALDGAESVIGAELLRGNPERLPGLMPSFVFLVALQLVGQDRALELSHRTSELIEEAQGR